MKSENLRTIDNTIHGARPEYARFLWLIVRRLSESCLSVASESTSAGCFAEKKKTSLKKKKKNEDEKKGAKRRRRASAPSDH